MKNSVSSLKTNFVYGLLILVPISILFLVLVAVVDILETAAEILGFRSATSAGIAIVLSMLLLVLLCFLLGALVRTKLGSVTMEMVEEKVLIQIPGYRIVSNILKGFVEQKSAFPPAMIQLHDAGTAALGFVMEENRNDTVTVFVPSTPAFTMGRVYVVTRERVTWIEANTMEFIDCISQWGAGTGKLLNISK